MYTGVLVNPTFVRLSQLFVRVRSLLEGDTHSNNLMTILPSMIVVVVKVGELTAVICRYTHPR